MNRTVIQNGKCVMRDSVEENVSLVLENGRIAGLIRSSDNVDGEVIDAKGWYVSPGFVDIHVHGGGGADFMDTDLDSYFTAAKLHLSHGTTSIMPTVLSADRESLFRAVEKYAAAEHDPRIKSRLLGLHIEGPYLSKAQAGAQDVKHIRNFLPSEYLAIMERGAGRIRRWSVAPELTGADAFAKAAREHDITLSIAHSDADFDTVVKAFEKGFRLVTHLYSGMSSVTRTRGFRKGGVLEAALLLDGMNVELIADSCHLPKELVCLVRKCKPAARIAAITDAMRAAGQNVSESVLGDMKSGVPVIIEDGVAKLRGGEAFGGSVATADRLLKTLLRFGTPLPEAVSMLTANPLAMIACGDKLGRIQSGYEADLCMFDEAIEITRVLVRGEMVYENGI
ncbi:MAG: amidohydrolase family protein [Spirochaetaceae bacterium]|jgi:N-acetylglucosamine-6-phosphate deacetylase|nr:amidohydrolase family protein [Spirochaetaceae bacterium]